jgi:hypothetical protein
MHFVFDTKGSDRILEIQNGQKTEYRKQEPESERETKFPAWYFEGLNLRQRLKLPELLNSVFCFLYSTPLKSQKRAPIAFAKIHRNIAFL